MKQESPRGRRRIDEDRMKVRSRRLLEQRYRIFPEAVISPREIGMHAATRRLCSCWMCSGHKDVAPRSQRGFALPR